MEKSYTAMEMKSYQAMGFVLTTIDAKGNSVTFEFEHSHNAEGVLRGLVHNGQQVTIKETIITVSRPVHPEEKRQRDYEHMQCAAQGIDARVVTGGMVNVNRGMY